MNLNEGLGLPPWFGSIIWFWKQLLHWLVTLVKWTYIGLYYATIVLAIVATVVLAILAIVATIWLVTVAFFEVYEFLIRTFEVAATRLYHFIKLSAIWLYHFFRDFWSNWTVAPRRFRWQTLKGFADASTPLLHSAHAPQSQGCETTSELCAECYRLINSSGLLSGSWLPMTRTKEWHKWVIPIHGDDFCLGRGACQLCHILWGTIDVPSQDRFKEQTATVLPEEVVCHIAIWKDLNRYWFQRQRYYIQIDQNQGRIDSIRQTCRTLNVEEGPLNQQCPSIQGSTSSGALKSFELAKSWIERCHTQHECHCRKDQSNYCLPSRLLFVGDATSSALRLVDTTSAQFQTTGIKYISLSYHHDDEAIPDRQILNNTNAEQWHEQINRKNLPLTFQHAILLTRQLGVNYLWIDCLCLSKDELSILKGKEQGIGLIYANSYCTIAATAAEDPEGGCFQNQKPFKYFQCNLRFSEASTLAIRPSLDTYNSRSFSAEVDHTKLGLQASFLQERLLSRRILYFGSHFMFFECNTHIASEAEPEGIPFHHAGTCGKDKQMALMPGPACVMTAFNPLDGHRAALGEIRRNRSTHPKAEDELLLHNRWFELLFFVTRPQASTDTDRNSLIAGLVQSIRGIDESIVCRHGLWERHLCYDLLWYIQSGVKLRPTHCSAPSWSWQAVNGRVAQDLVCNREEYIQMECKLTKVAEVIERQEQSLTDASSAIADDTLLIKCHLLRGSDLVAPTTDGKYGWLTIESVYESAKAQFAPDCADFRMNDEVFCAEILREEFRDPLASKSRSAIWSDGLVLQRSISTGSSDIKVRYQRVGRFWMMWPVAKQWNGKEHKVTILNMFNRRQRQTLSIA